MRSVNVMAVSIQDYEISCVKSSLWSLILEEKTVKHLKRKEHDLDNEISLCTKLTSVRKSLAALSFGEPELVIVFLLWYSAPLKFEFH